MEPTEENLSIKDRVKRDLYEEYLELRRSLFRIDSFPGPAPPPPLLKSFKAGSLSFYLNISHFLDVAIKRRPDSDLEILREIFGSVEIPQDLDLRNCRRALPLFAVFLNDVGVCDIWG